MCFSSTVSFAAAAVTGAIGVACLARVRRWRDAPLAATPLFFALQQAIEGALWLQLRGLPDASTGVLTLAFLLLAQVFWPIYSPVSVWLTEPDPRRRRWVAAILALGVGVSAYLLWALLRAPHHAFILRDHIAYRGGLPFYELAGLGYLLAAVTPLILSSYRMVRVMGAIVLVGSIVSYAFYIEVYQSIWCFFAAAASTALLGHFQWTGLRGPSPAAATPPSS